MTITEAIRATFPTGLLHEPVLDESRITDTREQVAAIALALSQITSLQICHQPRFRDERYFTFGSTLSPAPTADEWIWGYDTSAKLEYVSKHGGALPLWWAELSFVYPVWHHFFNLWTPRLADPKYLDANWTDEPPTTEWIVTLEIAERTIASHGYAHMDRAAFLPAVEFVRHEVYSDDDDDDDDLEPRLESCSIGQCLFSEF
jgi:hypothetical protein